MSKQRPIRSNYENQEQYEAALIEFGRKISGGGKSTMTIHIRPDLAERLISDKKTQKIKISNAVENALDKYFSDLDTVDVFN